MTQPERPEGLARGIAGFAGGMLFLAAAWLAKQQLVKVLGGRD